MRKRYLAGVAVFMVLLIAGTVWVIIDQDREGPVITIDEAQQLTWHSDMEKSELLQGVTALDDKAGDVTDSLMIESVKPQPDDKTAVVIYVAKDSSNNVAKVTRVIEYIDSDESTSDNDVQQEEVQTDLGEESPEDISSDSAEGADASEADVEADTTEVLNLEESEAQAAVARDEAIAALSGQAPRFYLKQHFVSINAGGSFDRLLWVEEITDDKDDRSRLFRNIQIKGEVDRQTPGTYELKYYVVDQDGNPSNEELLTVTVN